MSARPFHKRYHSDALAGFMALSLEERGAYQTLLDMIYDRGGPVLDNDRLLAGYMQCSIRRWRVIRESLVRKGKIRATNDGHLTNDRAEKEIENDAKTTRKLAENGSKGGQTRAENQKKDNENSDGEQAPLKPRSSLTRYQIPDTREERASKPVPLPPRESPPMNPDLARVMATGRFVQIPADAALLKRWQADGADLDKDIIPTIERETEALIGRTGRGPFKLQVFDTAIRRKLAEDAAQVEAWRRSGDALRQTLDQQQADDRREAEERERFQRRATA